MTDTYIYLSGGPPTGNADAGLGAVFADCVTLDALQVTMAGVGSGDNSANVTTMETNLDTLESDLRAISGTNADVATLASRVGSVVVIIDSTNVSTVSQLRAIFNGMLAEAMSKGLTA